MVARQAVLDMMLQLIFLVCAICMVPSGGAPLISGPTSVAQVEKVVQPNISDEGGEALPEKPSVDQKQKLEAARSNRKKDQRAAYQEQQRITQERLQEAKRLRDAQFNKDSQANQERKKELDNKRKSLERKQREIELERERKEREEALRKEGTMDLAAAAQQTRSPQPSSHGSTTTTTTTTTTSAPLVRKFPKSDDLLKNSISFMAPAKSPSPRSSPKPKLPPTTTTTTTTTFTTTMPPTTTTEAQPMEAMPLQMGPLISYDFKRDSLKTSKNGSLIMADVSGNGNDADMSMGKVEFKDDEYMGYADFSGKSTIPIPNLFFPTESVISGMTVVVWFRTSKSCKKVNCNYAFVDYDKSEFFNFFIRGDGMLQFSSRKTGCTSIDDFYETQSSETDQSGDLKPLNDGNWHMAAISFDARQKGQKSIYRDGALSALKELGVDAKGRGMKIGGGRVRFGYIGDGSMAETYGGPNYKIFYTGQLASVAIYSRALKASEIRAHYDSLKPRFRYLAKDCIPPEDVEGLDFSDCQMGKKECLEDSPESDCTCQAKCADAYEMVGQASTYKCGVIPEMKKAFFHGEPPTCEPIKCPDPEKAPPGAEYMNCTTMSNGDECLSRCIQGWWGEPTKIGCQVRGNKPRLIGMAAHCIHVTCTPPDVPEGALATDCKTKYDEEICTVSCKDGYKGESVIQTCDVQGEKGTFSGPAIQCAEVKCAAKAKDSVAYGIDVGNCTRPMQNGQYCITGCDDGYAGDTSIYECEVEGTVGTLKGHDPECSRIACPAHAGEKGVEFKNCSGQYVGEGCKAWCAPGYVGKPTSFQCKQSGNFGVWNGESPKCEPIKCKPPPPSFGADVSDCIGKYDGDTCKVKCISSFKGNPTQLKCEVGIDSGNFTGQMPVCSTVKCPTPENVPENVDVSRCVGLKNKQTCNITCGPKFEGTPTQFLCEVSGTVGVFTGGLPTCAPIKCPTPFTDAPGVQFVDCENKIDGGSCKAVCDKKHLGVTTSLSCEVSGWTAAYKGDMPTCEAVECEAPMEMDQIDFINCTGRTEGEPCVAECAAKYDGEGTVLQCSVDNKKGFFKGATPDCVPVKCEEPAPMQAVDFTDCPNKFDKDTCQAKCMPKFLGEPKTLTCDVVGKAGKLKGAKPVCESIKCTDPDPVENIDISECVGKIDGESCEVSCGRGYVGTSSALTCYVTNSTVHGYQGSLPKCEPVKCDPPKTSNHSIETPDCSDKLDKQTCTASCAHGWKGAPTELECKVDDKTGSMMGEMPKCTPVLCPPPESVPENVDSSDCSGDHRDGSTCKLKCNEFFKGKESGMTCVVKGETGNFRGNFPKCTPVTCAPPGHTLGAGAEIAFEDCADKTHKGTCGAKCVHGWKGEPTMLTCDVEGNGPWGMFKGCLPVCEKVVCKAPEPQEGTDFIGCAGRNLGEKCTGECKTYKGYRGDPKVLQCEVEGTTGVMTGEMPSCSIRRTFDGTRCIFPVKYKEDIIDDCVKYKKEDGTDAEWCFTNPATGIVGDCDPTTAYK